MVIGRLEEETASSREECERAAEARVRRIRDKYEAELREVERSERQTLEKFNNMKVRFRYVFGKGIYSAHSHKSNKLQSQYRCTFNIRMFVFYG